MGYKLEDVYRALKFLNLPVDSLSSIRDGFEKLASMSGYLLTQVVKDLDALDVLEASYSQETGSANFALVRADVLSYTPSQRVVGILLQMYQLSKRVGRNLGVLPDLLIIEQSLRALGVKGLNAPQINGRIIR